MGWFDSLRDCKLAAAHAVRGLSRCAVQVCAAASAALPAGPGYGADDFPPPMDTKAAPAQPAEEQQPTAFGTPVPYWTHRLDDPSAPKPQKDVQIEQKHIGRRVSEVIVTPAGFTFHYSITHLDDQDPGTTPLQPHPELSVPRLFRFDF
jgi:hypothetical protein